MSTRSSPSSASPLIKGYLPVRVKLSSSDDASHHDETFFFVKEHRDGNETKDTSSNKKKKGATLFVVNAPTVPLVRTRLLLKSLLGRFGEVSRVTVVPNPRHAQLEADELLHQQATLWTTKFGLPSFLPPPYSEGKFAHVVFASPKDMRRTLRALTEIMSASSSASSTITADDTLPGLTLDRVEIQTLADESDRQLQEERASGKDDEDTSWNNDVDNDAVPDNSQSAVVRLAERYQASLYSRDSLLQECNDVMEQFETAEEKDLLAREAAANQPDDDGFVTVTHSSQVGSKRELEECNNGQRRKKGQKRSRSKKKGPGASELQDFYRFQTKEKRKKSLQELRRRFEDDLAKVKKMKEEKQYQPF